MELTTDLALDLRDELNDLRGILSPGKPVTDAVKIFAAGFHSQPRDAAIPPIWKTDGEYYLQKIFDIMKAAKPQGEAFAASSDVEIALVYGAVKVALENHGIDIEQVMYGSPAAGRSFQGRNPRRDPLMPDGSNRTK